MLLPQQVCWQWPRCWAGTELGQLTLTDQRDISYWIMWSSEIKSGGKKEERGDIWCLPSQITIMCEGALLSWKWEILTLGSGAGIAGLIEKDVPCISEECTHKGLFFKQGKTYHLHPHLHLKKIKSENAQKLELFNPADNSVGAEWISVLGYEWAQAAVVNDICTVACGHIVILSLCLSKSFLCSVKDISLHCHQFVSSCEKARELELMGIAENTELAVFLQIPGRTDFSNWQHVQQ